VLLCNVLLLAQNDTASPTSGDDPAAMRQRIVALEQRVAELERQMQALLNAQQAATMTAPAPAAATTGVTDQTAVAATPPQTQDTGTGAPAQPASGGAPDAKALNPDMSMIGDFIGRAGGNSIQPGRSLEMHEAEVGMQAIIDPYARGDVFLSFGEDGVNLEEGYITFTALPGIVPRFGKMRSAFGKANLMHNHTMPWVDRPLVINNLLGGEDGIDDAGVSASYIVPAPKGIFLEATGQVFRGDSGTNEDPVFRASRSSDVSTVAHLRGYADVSESTNIDLGASYARGHNELGSAFLTHLYGVDATLRWKPLRRSIYRSFILRSEFIWSQRRDVTQLERAFGFYTSADYQLLRRWFLGGRLDWSERSRLADVADRGASLVLTYWPSEFSQIRGQYRITSYAEDVKANELFLQLIFSLGAHGAHPF